MNRNHWKLYRPNQRNLGHCRETNAAYVDRHWQQSRRDMPRHGWWNWLALLAGAVLLGVML